MRDNEMLELAAKAAGYVCKWHPDDPFFLRSMHIAPKWEPWNPLDNEADALALAKKLGLLVRLVETGINVIFKANDQLMQLSVSHNGNVSTATRRAIVRAAAELGRLMP